MKNTGAILFAFLIFCSPVLGQQKTDLRVDFMKKAKILAKSSIEDTTVFGGFGGSDNAPKTIDKQTDFSEKNLFLKVDTTEYTALNDTTRGYKFYIVNNSDELIKLSAADSRLSVIAEVLYKGEWKPIEYLPTVWCGNSYHHVYLRQNEYWEFVVPKFSGEIATKLRYRLEIGKETFIYSNEIATSINKGQLTKKEDVPSDGFMDSFND